MKLYRRTEGGVWHVDHTLPDGTRLRFSTKQTDKRKAESVAHTAIAERAVENATGEVVEASPKLGAALRRVYEEHWAHFLSDGWYVGLIRYMDERWGQTPLSEIDEDWLQELVDNFRREGNTGATINRKMSLLQTGMRHASRWREYRGTFRMPQFPHQRESEGRVRFFTHVEEEDLLEAIRGRASLSPEGMGWAVFERLVIVLLDTGMRLSEAWRIRSDLVSDHQLTVITTKHKRGRVRRRAIPLTKRAEEALEWLFKTNGPEPFKDWTPALARKHWNKVREEIGLKDDPEAVLHALRHTCASRLIQGGVAITAVRDWLGHSSVGVTERYAHLGPSALQAAVSALEPQKAERPRPALRIV